MAKIQQRNYFSGEKMYTQSRIHVPSRIIDRLRWNSDTAISFHVRIRDGKKILEIRTTMSDEDGSNSSTSDNNINNSKG